MKIEKVITILNYLATKLGAIDKLKAIKFLFFIDKEHLIKYGRFVTDGKYLKYSPELVPTKIFNIITVPEILSDDKKQYLFDNLDIDLNDRYRAMTSKKEPDLLELSKSELKITDIIINKYGNYTESQLIDAIHKEYAYNQKVVPLLIPVFL